MATAVTQRFPGDDRDARARFRPWFLADWRDAVFLHYAFEPDVLQPHVPFQLDLFDGRAWVSLVAFTQRRMRPALGGRWTSWLTAPVADHAFLNLRTYVRGAGHAGICFLAEWIPNRLARVVGPLLYGLPFRLARLDYTTTTRAVRAGQSAWRLDTPNLLAGPLAGRIAQPGTLDEFLLERYTAFTARRGRGRMFHIRHEPWLYRPADATVIDDTLLREAAPWLAHGRRVAAHVSEGLTDVRIGGPHRVQTIEADQLVPTAATARGTPVA